MYKKILIALDNSPDANAAVDLGLAVAKANKARLTGTHVYAARLHDQRFAEMEATLPARYQAPEELKRQRKTHESLIERGLKTIADSYSLALEQKAKEAGLEFENRPREGKNYFEILLEATEGSHDLVILGATGLGKVDRIGIGSVSERVMRRVRLDALVTRAASAEYKKTIVVGIDGSQRSFGALTTAINFAKTFGARIEAASVYDADFHYKAFKTLSTMLPEETASSFDFKAQEKLHEEIIDGGLKAIYSGHLESAKRLAALEGVEIKTTLLSGKPFDALIGHIEKTRPFMLALGRTGFHADASLDLGSNAENCLRLAPCHVLLAARKVLPLPEDKPGDAPVLKWSIEALEILDRIPIFAREMAKRLIEKRAGDDGLCMITADYMRFVRSELGMPDVKNFSKDKKND